LETIGSFDVVVQPLTPVFLTPVRLAEGQFQFSVTGPVGPDYLFQRSSDLNHWIILFSNTPAALPLIVSDTNASPGIQFYRALLGP
jgi:hypothetical protein